MAVTFKVTVVGGPEMIYERRLEFPTAHIPAPGTTVPVTYAVGLASATIDVVVAAQEERRPLRGAAHPGAFLSRVSESMGSTARISPDRVSPERLMTV